MRVVQYVLHGTRRAMPGIYQPPLVFVGLVSTSCRAESDGVHTPPKGHSTSPDIHTPRDYSAQEFEVMPSPRAFFTPVRYPNSTPWERNHQGRLNNKEPLNANYHAGHHSISLDAGPGPARRIPTRCTRLPTSSIIATQMDPGPDLQTQTTSQPEYDPSVHRPATAQTLHATNRHVTSQPIWSSEAKSSVDLVAPLAYLLLSLGFSPGPHAPRLSRLPRARLPLHFL